MAAFLSVCLSSCHFRRHADGALRIVCAIDASGLASRHALIVGPGRVHAGRRSSEHAEEVALESVPDLGRDRRMPADVPTLAVLLPEAAPEPSSDGVFREEDHHQPPVGAGSLRRDLCILRQRGVRVVEQRCAERSAALGDVKPSYERGVHGGPAAGFLHYGGGSPRSSVALQHARRAHRLGRRTFAKPEFAILQGLRARGREAHASPERQYKGRHGKRHG
mmetsp:Transcript_91083/g.253602  ORF Transcript_91083/g.253602 Transcript_91083/m.253602 type:complete len:221 (+) Transcript_91083:710-1372(+)